MTKYFLHVGLHKTATKFLQHKLFPNLEKNHYFYNPPKLTQLVCDLMKGSDKDLAKIYDAINNEKMLLDEEANCVLISREVMSGDLFSFYKDYEEKQVRLSKAFPSADIIVTLRFQPDWLLSCYRESVHMHHFQKFEQFISLKAGDKKFIHHMYKELDIVNIVVSYHNLFGKKNVHVLFYEDFKKNKSVYLDSLSDILKTRLEVTQGIRSKNNSIPNRGYSAFSIWLSIFRYKLLELIKLERFLIHRPIKLFGEGSIPAGYEELSILPKEKYWGKQFKRDNEEIRSKGYPDALTFSEKFKMFFSWRKFIKEGIDKLIYWDWDLKKNIEQELESYFREKNLDLIKRVGLSKNKIPSVYLIKKD
jgi:hypothetical protein